MVRSAVRGIFQALVVAVALATGVAVVGVSSARAQGAEPSPGPRRNRIGGSLLLASSMTDRRWTQLMLLVTYVRRFDRLGVEVAFGTSWFSPTGLLGARYYLSDYVPFRPFVRAGLTRERTWDNEPDFVSETFWTRSFQAGIAFEPRLGDDARLTVMGGYGAFERGQGTWQVDKVWEHGWFGELGVGYLF
jgi:hypothetical protein